MPRTSHAAALLNNGTTLMVYGGWDPNTEVEGEVDLIFLHQPPPGHQDLDVEGQVEAALQEVDHH